MLLPVIIAIAAAPARAQDVIRSEAFAPLERVGTGQTGLSAGGDGGGGFQRRSIDEELVIAIIQDRARQFAIRTLTTVLECNAAIAQRLYIRDVLEAAARLLDSSHVLRTAALEDLAKTVLRALIAEAVVRVQFGDERRIVNAVVTGDSPGPWVNRRGPPADDAASDEPVALEWTPPDGTDAVLLRAHLVSWAYWALGYETWLESSNHDAPTTCPFAADASGVELCSRLNRGGEARRNGIAEFFRLDDLTQAIEIARTLYARYQANGRVDLGQIIEALAGWSHSFANFADFEGLRLAEDFGPVEGVAKLADALAGLRTLPSLRPGPGGSTNTPDFAAVPERAEALAVLLCQPEDATEESWRTVMAAHLATLPAASEDLCTALRELEDWEPGQPWPASAALSSLQTNNTFVALRALAREMSSNFPTVMRDLHDARSQFQALLLASRDSETSLDLEHVRLEALQSLLTSLVTIVTKTEEAITSYVRLFPSGPLRQGLLRISDALSRVRGVLTLLVEVAPQLDGQDTVGQLRAILRTLVGRTEGGNRVAIVFELLEPVLSELAAGRPLSRATLVALLVGVRPGQVLAALGIEGDSETLCEADAEGVHCWTARIVELVLASIRNVDGTITLDGDRMIDAAAVIGDDFGRTERARFYVHATIGIGGLFSDPPGADPARMVPLVAEQLGFGRAWPTSWGNIKIALFGSGILYRILLDHQESDAISGGLALATDIGELLELYLSGQLLFYPPEGMDEDTDVRGAFAFGVQIPLGDYLSRVESDDDD